MYLCRHIMVSHRGLTPVTQSVSQSRRRHTHTHPHTPIHAHTQMRGSLSAVRSIAPNKHPSIQMQTSNNANNTSSQRSQSVRSSVYLYKNQPSYFRVCVCMSVCTCWGKRALTRTHTCMPSEWVRQNGWPHTEKILTAAYTHAHRGRHTE